MMADNRENIDQNTQLNKSINITGSTNRIEGDIVGGDKIVYAGETDLITNYLESIIRDENQLAQRYISLSSVTRKERAAPTEWPQGLIPTAFKLIDRVTKPSEINTSVTLDSVEDALEIHSQFVLLGDPGAGKTTTLIKLRLDQAKRVLRNKDQKIPILINLSEWSDDFRDVPSFILHQQKLLGIPNIHFGRMLILLDGLNEMDADDYEQRVEWLNEWLTANRFVSVIVSCRSSVYREREQLRLPTVLVHSLDEMRIQKFLHAYLGEEDGDSLLRNLRPEDPNRRSKRDLIHLATNPFLLSMISYVYVQKNKSLPTNRGNLFQMFVEVLYAREVEKGTTKSIAYADLITGLSEIAFSMQAKRTALTMPIAWASKQISNTHQLQDLLYLASQASLMTMSTEDYSYRYSHQLIMEYFAAEALIAKTNELNEIIPLPVIKNRRRMSSNWDEVSFMAIGITDPGEFISKISPREPFLAVDCLYHSSLDYSPPNEILEILVQNLMKLFKRDKDIRQVAIVKLGELGPQILPFLSRVFNDKKGADTIIRRSILAVASGYDGSLIKDILRKGLEDRNRWVRRDAMRIFKDKLPPEDGVIEDSNEIDDLDHNRVEALTSEKPLTEKLYSTAQGDVNKLINDMGSERAGVRRTARRKIIQMGNSITYQLLDALRNDNPSIRRGATFCIGILGDKSLTKYLFPLLYDETPIVRAWAIRAMSRLNDSSMRVVLEKLISDPSQEVASAAIKALGVIKDSKSIVPLAKNLESPNVDINTRRTIISVLGNFQDEHATDILARCLVNDQDQVIRRKSAAILGDIGDKRAIEFLIDALNDSNITVRINVIKALGLLGDSRAEKHLEVFAAGNFSWETRITAIGALGNLGSSDCIEILKSIKDKEYDDSIVNAVNQELDKLNAKSNF